MTQTPAMDTAGLRARAAEALRRQDPGSARPLFQRLLTVEPADAGALMGLALACHGLRDAEGRLDALDRLLARSPNHMMALMMKGDHFAEAGDGRAAQTFYGAVVARAPAPETLPPDLAREVRRAAAAVEGYKKRFEDHLRGQVAAASGDLPVSRRFAQSMDLLLGKKEVYFQSPSSFYFPELPQKQFYEREDFSWTANLETQTAGIRAEAVSVMSDEQSFQPYVQTDANRPPAEFGVLRGNRDWSAFHLIRSGEVVQEAAARCPLTMAALRGVPLTDAPGRTPSVMFSLLRAGAKIQPHNGQINARLICHLPLLVPVGCGFRVGNETRPWVEGETLIFDDTIEHEAWNDSGLPRLVLLFEVWRPELTARERQLVAALLAAVGSYGGTTPARA